MAKIKVNRQEIEIKLGDYIYDNGSCVQIFSGDGRNIFYYKTSTIQRARAIVHTDNVMLPKKLVKRLAKVLLWEKNKKKVIREIDLQIIDKLQE